jgi:hypothetical protein
MSDLYIRSKGATKTLIRSNDRENIKQFDWDADYNGDRANISLDMSEKGDHDHYQIQLSKEDLDKLFTVPPVNQPIHQRLQNDFLEAKKRYPTMQTRNHRRKTRRFTNRKRRRNKNTRRSM